MSKIKLFDEEQDEESDNESTEVGLNVNTDYAEKYDKWRSAEEFQKLKSKYGDDFEQSDGSVSDSESESSSEDEPELLANDKSWLRTLSLIKAKDERIYDPSFKPYPGDTGNSDKVATKKVKSEKPMYLRDYERKMILEADGKLVDEDEEILAGKPSEDTEIPLAYNEEQRRLKESFKQFLEDDSDGDEPLLKEKDKSQEQQDEEEVAYLQWLRGHPDVQVEASEAKDLEPLRNFWNDPKLSANDKFLRDFVISGTAVMNSCEDVDESGPVDDVVDLDDDDADVEKQAEFERKYNFRFEEPDAEFVQSYPRTVADSLRKKDDNRAKKREERKKRKQQEEIERREELRHLKRMKRQEITEKLQKLRQISGGGDDELGFQVDDLEGDYDPEAHSKMLERVFNDDYFEMAEDVRPEVDFDDDDMGHYGEDVKAEAGSDWEDAAEPADEGDGEPSTSKAEEDGRPWRRKKSRVAMALAKEKPAFNPEERKFEEYLDEYYKMDYEDVVGGMPCRFRYRKVEPVDFGLDAKEVLKARDKELNSWVSVKRVVQYRRHEDDLKDKRRYEQKSQNEHKKLRILPSLAEEKASELQPNSGKQQKSKKKQRKANKSDPLSAFSDDRVRAYGLDPVKFKYTKHRFVQKDLKQGAGKSKNKKSSSKTRPVFA